MHHGSRDKQSRPRLPLMLGLVAAFATAAAVSWLTPDGNLVVTLVPAAAVGLATFGLASWLSRRAAKRL